MSSYKKKIHKKLYNFSKDLVGEKVLKTYMKQSKIKYFQTNTLVPLALLLGGDEFMYFIKDSIQIGGAITNNVNIMEDPLIHNYLKLTGMSENDIDHNTLIPIGVLKLIYYMYNKNLNQTNGQLTKYINKYWNKNIITLLSKHQNIKKFITSTLVPLAVILDNETLKKHVIENYDTNISKRKLKFLNDPLLVNYFRLIGLSKKNLYISTLVPLGILTVLHHLYFE